MDTFDCQHDSTEEAYKPRQTLCIQTSVRVRLGEVNPHLYNPMDFIKHIFLMSMAEYSSTDWEHK